MTILKWKTQSGTTSLGRLQRLVPAINTLQGNDSHQNTFGFPCWAGVKLYGSWKMAVDDFNQVTTLILAAVLDMYSLQSLELICIYWFHFLLQETQTTGSLLLLLGRENNFLYYLTQRYLSSPVLHQEDSIKSLCPISQDIKLLRYTDYIALIGPKHTKCVFGYI